ncbi:MAG TPA: thiamine phosphate synthase [Bacillota bacterium]|nr:thiamine phosphate synthase [Bacillota bacterium]
MTDLGKRLRKYFIMGSQNCDRDPVEILTEAIQGGITAFQFREKGPGSLSGHAKLDLGKKLRTICEHNGVLFFINDDIDLVTPLGADGIHVGQDDTSVQYIRERYPNKIIGLSVSNYEELTQSHLESVDYIGAGAIFSTATKKDANRPVGVEWIKFLKHRYPDIPVVGIGGITVQNAQLVIDAGADGVSFISALTEASNIQAVLEKL